VESVASTAPPSPYPCRKAPEGSRWADLEDSDEECKWPYEVVGAAPSFASNSQPCELERTLPKARWADAQGSDGEIPATRPLCKSDNQHIDGAVTVRISYMNGELLNNATMSMAPPFTGAQVKKHIEETERIPVSQQTLFRDDRVMEDCDKIHSFHGDNVDLTLFRKEPRFRFQGFVRWEQVATSQSDDDQDRAMEEACARAFPGGRAATGEQYENRLILDMPAIFVQAAGAETLAFKNPGSVGDDDARCVSGHARKGVKYGDALDGTFTCPRLINAKRMVICVAEE